MDPANNNSIAGNRQIEEKSPGDLLLKIIFGFAGVSIVICALVVLGVLFKVWGPSYFGPKIQIILEPDYSQVSTVDPSDLESAVEILNARCRSLGYGAPFKVADGDRIIAQVPASVDIEFLTGKVVAMGLLEFVDFGDTPIPPGTEIATDFNVKYFPLVEGTQWHTVMTNSEIRSVEVTKDYIDKPAISFSLTAAGTKILSDHTAKNTGRYLGIVLDKVVLSSPRISSPITDGLGIIQGSFELEEAKILVSYLRAKGPLPVPLVVKDISQIGEK